MSYILLQINNFGLPFGEGIIKGYYLMVLVFSLIMARSIVNYRRLILGRQSVLRFLIVFLLVCYSILRVQNIATAVYIFFCFSILVVGYSQGRRKEGYLLYNFFLLAMLIFYLALPADCGVSDQGLKTRHENSNHLCSIVYVGESGQRRLSAGMSDPNHFSFAIVSFFYIVSFLPIRSSRASLILSILCIFASGSRAAVISLAILCYQYLKSKINIIFVVLVLALGLILFYFILKNIRENAFDIESIKRFAIWVYYIDIIFHRDVASFFFGSGLDLNYAISLSGFDFDRAPHNTVILIIYQLGLIGLMLWGGVLVSSGRYFILVMPFVFTLDLIYSVVLWYAVGAVWGLKESYGFKDEDNAILYKCK